MFNPSELEGEVDHSFFDSDCDNGHVSGDGDGGKKIDGCLKTEKKRPPAHERLYANTAHGLSLRTDGTKKDPKQVEDKSTSGAERKDNSCQSKEEVRSRAASASSVASTSHNGSDCEEDSNFQSNGTFLALLAEARVVDDEDVYHQSPNKTEEEALSSNPKYSGSKGRNKRSPKKIIRRQRPRSPSPTSSEVSTDTERSCSSSEPPILPRPNEPSLSPGVRRTRVGSMGSRDLPPLRTEESEDTLTDVSPLLSHDVSPLQSLDLNHTEVEDGSLKEQQRERVPSSGLSNIHQDEDSDPDVDECSLSSESQLPVKLGFNCPGGRHRKNYSFTNDEVRSIDRENQRLLRELSRISSASKPGSAAGRKSHTANKLPLTRLSHSALNRQREQQRIERDNLAFLKRLESVKPSPGLKCSDQLADYHRQVGYLGAPPSSTKEERSNSRTTSAGKGPRAASAAHHSTRTASITTNSRSTPVPRSKKLSKARPDWC